jgi:hypothetical protein
MSERTESQILGSQGQSLVAHLINSSGDWIARAQDEDYGIDMEAELSSPAVTGQLLKFQVKASKSVEATDQGILCQIPRKLAAYADSCRLPVILVRVEIETQQAWYLWVQHWVLEKRRAGFGLKELPEMITHHIPAASTLVAGLAGELRSIAQWKTQTQLVLTVNDAIRTAASVYDFDVLNHLVALLGKLDVVNDEFPVNMVIERALELGPNLWATHEGNQASSTLYAICRHFGRSFTAEQVFRMVTRGDSCSRTGLNALGILYDRYFEHTARLGLVSIFLTHADARVAFYCNLRESSPGKEFVECLTGAYGTQFGGLVLDPSLKEAWMEKWPNRGDSVLLDYLYDPLPSKD